MNAETFLPEFDQEMALTRRVLERVPDENPDWKPHPKSFSIAHLAQLVARMPGWFTNVLNETRLDLAGAQPYSTEKTNTLLAEFDRLVPEARAAIAKSRPEDFVVKWSLAHGSNVLYSASRAEVARQTMSHIAHHRGQLTVYLRMRDVPVPSVYGPTADEGWGG